MVTVTYNTVKITLSRIFNHVSRAHTMTRPVRVTPTASITILTLFLQNVPPTQMLVASQPLLTTITMVKTVSPSPEDVLHLT